MSSLTLSLAHLTEQAGAPRDVGHYDLVEMRRQPIEWDQLTRVGHHVNCGMNIGCSLTAYTWKGIVLREEQSANYDPPNNPEIPDRNPRGCQLGVCFTHRMYDPQRIKFPVKRVGERGSGRWERLSWDQAFTEIADSLIDIMVNHGPKTVVNAGGTQAEGGGGFGKSAWATLAAGAGMLVSMPNTDIGDDHEGALVTFGRSDFVSSAEDWYGADMLFLWGVNPAYTQVTWCHYIAEARYNGTKVVSISPDFNASATLVDEWVPVDAGTDAALALAMAQVIVSESLHNEAFIKEQSDLGLLVRSDNGKFLRHSDLEEGGREYAYYLFDRTSGAVTEAPYRTLSLGELDPALDGTYTVQTRDGEVEVRPVFALLSEMLDRDYTPEQASAMCGVHPDTIRRLAREFATAKGVVNLIHYASGRYYHGNLIERAMIYLWLLCGHLGRPGANYNAFGSLLLPEPESGTLLDAIVETAMFHPRYEEWQERNFSDYRIRKEMFAEMAPEFIRDTALFYFLHTGLMEASASEGNWDPHLKRTVQEYIDEALASGKRSLVPGRGADPKALVAWGGDPVRRMRRNQLLIENLLPKLDLVLTIDWRWSGTATYSDYVLPACGLYENTKSFVAYTLGTQPIGHFSFKAAEPLYESKSDYWIGVMLLKKLAQRAREREIGTFTDPLTGAEYNLDHIDAIATENDRLSEHDEEVVAREMYETASNVEQIGWPELKARGWAHFTSSGTDTMSGDFPDGIKPGEALIPLQRHVRDKEPYTTATGRIQTYIDHDWYLELGETFACHKEPPKAGGDFPLVLSGGHARWSIHTMWSENPLMLRLQRGEPIIVISDQDARARGICDGDLVEVFNDVGNFQIAAAVTSRVPPGFTVIYHAWTNAQFRKGKHFQQVMPSPFNPIEFVPVTFAEYPNLTWDLWSGSPGSSDRETRVEVKPASS